MDKEQAKLILACFRPNGADVGDAHFADALKLSLEDRELGEWLANERAFDATFSKCLTSVTSPSSLRDDILASLVVAREDYPQACDSEDAAWIGAISTIQPPHRLRESIIAAMHVTADEKNKVVNFRRVMIPLTAAAGIALAFLVGRSNTSHRVAVSPNTSQHVVAASSTVPIAELQAGFIRAYESPLFRLDEKRDDHQVLIQHLENRALPCPKILPPGLRNVAGIGCRELVIDGKRGSLVCFDERENGVVHLVIFRRSDVCGDLPSCGQPHIAKEGNWATARWADETNVFLMISHTEPKKLAGLF